MRQKPESPEGAGKGARPWHPVLRKLLREPLVHFALLGGMIFALWAALNRSPPDQADQAPVSGDRSISRTVLVTPGDVDTMRASFRAAWKRDPDADELADQIQAFVSEEILFREGTALGLDRDDVVVRRRVIEKMTVLARPTGNRGEPSRDELQRWYQVYRHRFRRPTELSFTHFYFDDKKRADPAAAARTALASLSGAPDADSAAVGTVGDSFVLPTTMNDKTEVQVAHLFGEGFARALVAAPVGSWQGPQTSNFGVHVFKVTRRQPGRLPAFEEIDKHVRADWLTVETRGLRAAAESLAPRYQVQLDPALPAALGQAPSLAPLLRRPR
jgi:peptidyl-prolyl cis-trans isomerase C